MSSVQCDSRCYKIQLISHLIAQYLISNLIDRRTFQTWCTLLSVNGCCTDASLLCKSLKSFKWGEFKLCNSIALTGDLYMLLEMLYECFKTNISWSNQYLRIAGAWLYVFAMRVWLPLQECLHALQAFSLQHFLGSRLDALQLSPALKPSLYRIPFTFKIKVICYCSRTWHIGRD